MRTTRYLYGRRWSLAGAFAVLALLATSCGGAGGGQGQAQTPQTGATTPPGTTSPAPPASPAAQAATVAVEKSSYGKVLVDGGGRALYLFKKDTQGNSNCYGKCAQVWPPMITQNPPRAMEGAKATLLDTITRKNGATQVTYAGHPLYYYAPDQGSGAFKGQDVKGFGAEWYLVTPTGQAAHGTGNGNGNGGPY